MCYAPFRKEKAYIHRSSMTCLSDKAWYTMEPGYELRYFDSMSIPLDCSPAHQPLGLIGPGYVLESEQIKHIQVICLIV